jgi:hypothetical protein
METSINIALMLTAPATRYEVTREKLVNSLEAEAKHSANK